MYKMGGVETESEVCVWFTPRANTAYNLTIRCVKTDNGRTALSQTGSTIVVQWYTYITIY